MGMPVVVHPDGPTGPYRPSAKVRNCSNLRIETGNASLRRAFRQNGQRPLTIGFDYGDLGTFHPTGDYASMLNSLMGETVRYLPLACEWEEIPEAYKAHIFPTLESYFDLASWYNNQDKVVMGNNVYTVGDRVKLGLQLKLRILWRKNKQRIKADHFTRYGSAEEARNHLPPKKVWGDRTEDEWNNLVDWWSHPDRVARSLQNAANRAKNTILTHQGKKSFAQGRNEYKVQKGHYEDLIETWRKTHSRPETGEFKTKKKNLKRTVNMQDQLSPSSRTKDISRYLGMKSVSEYNHAEHSAKWQEFTGLVAQLPADAVLSHFQMELAGEDNDVGDNEEADSQQSSGDYSEDEEGDNEENLHRNFDINTQDEGTRSSAKERDKGTSSLAISLIVKPVKNQEQSHKEKETSNAEKEATGTPPESAIAVSQPIKNPKQHARGKEKTAKRSLF
ncbi:acidic leucine-rich nuclear phosphoprotein 32 family member A [Tanacetum coccineum]